MLVQFFNRSLSIIAAIGLMTFCALYQPSISTFKIGLGLVLPLACIWIPETIASYADYSRKIFNSSKAPSLIITSLGWLILIGVPLFIYLLGLSR